MHGSKDVVELVSKTPAAIGYSGMGYATPDVKMLRVAKKAGDKAYAPTVENTLNHTYPIARPLFMYTLGEPSGAAVPVLPFLFTGGTVAVLTSCALAAVVLTTVGAVVAFLSGTSPVRSAARMVGLAALAAGITYTVGRLFGAAVS